MAGVSALNEIEIGAEGTYGTAVTPDLRWRGLGTAPADMREVVLVEESVGSVTGFNRNYSGFTEGEMTFEESVCSFEQLPHVLAAGIKTVASSQDGAGSGYIYAYPFPTTAQNTVKSYTIRGGDDERVLQMKGSVVTSFTLSGEAKGPINLAATWKGHGPTTSSFAGLSFTTAEIALFQKAKLYIDDTTAYSATYPGPAFSTQITNTFLSFSLEATTGQMPVHTGDGSLNASFVKNPRGEYILTVTFENDSNVTAEFANFQAGTPRGVSIEIQGTALGTAGDFTYKTILIDALGVWTAFPSPSDQDGNNVVEAQLTIREDATEATAGRIVVVNELTALP